MTKTRVRRGLGSEGIAGASEMSDDCKHEKTSSFYYTGADYAGEVCDACGASVNLFAKDLKRRMGEMAEQAKQERVNAEILGK